jgi:hypothetical protein
MTEKRGNMKTQQCMSQLQSKEPDTIRRDQAA